MVDTVLFRLQNLFFALQIGEALRFFDVRLRVFAGKLQNFLRAARRVRTGMGKQLDRKSVV